MIDFFYFIPCFRGLPGPLLGCTGETVNCVILDVTILDDIPTHVVAGVSIVLELICDGAWMFSLFAQSEQDGVIFGVIMLEDIPKYVLVGVSNDLGLRCDGVCMFSLFA